MGPSQQPPLPPHTHTYTPKLFESSTANPRASEALILIDKLSELGKAPAGFNKDKWHHRSSSPVVSDKHTRVPDRNMIYRWLIIKCVLYDSEEEFSFHHWGRFHFSYWFSPINDIHIQDVQYNRFDSTLVFIHNKTEYLFYLSSVR